MNIRKKSGLLLTAALVPALFATGCTTTTEPDAAATGAAGSTSAAGSGEQLPIEELCGTEPIRIAHVAGFGANSWRKITAAELEDQMSACPNVTVEYTQTDGDLQKYITAINSYTAQGYDAIITYDDFGSQALGALSSAYNAGVVVVPYIADPGGEVGVDYNGYAAYDFDTEGDVMAKWLNGLLPDGGNLLFTGGLPGGSPSTVELLDGIKETMSETDSKYTLLSDDPVPSGWDPAVMQKAMAGALTQYGEFQAWASDYGVADLGGLRAMVNAGVSIPPLATSATDNELGCFWLEQKDANPDFQLLTLDGTTSVVRTAGLKALAAVNGLEDNYPESVELTTFIDTVNGKLPTCRDDLPPDADLSSSLSEEELAAVFK